jgi:hypothetical protein
LLFRAQTNNRYPTHPITIDNGENQPNENIFYLILNAKHSLFFLTSGNTTILQITIKIDPILPGTRNFEVAIPTQSDGLIVLVSRKPEISRTGQHVLDFHHRLTLPSIKNCIFTRNEEHKDVLALRKVSNSTFEIDTYVNLHPLVVFVIALTCCISKVR